MSNPTVEPSLEVLQEVDWKLKQLNHDLFAVEDKLPHWNRIRQQLYRARIELGQAQQMVESTREARLSEESAQGQKSD